MSFELKANEPVNRGIPRNVKNQIEKVLKQLGTKGDPPQKHGLENEVVHEVRKCFKRVRAALRLVREELGDELYHEENWRFRDAARPLTEVRDAHILVETAEKLKKQHPEAIEPVAFAKIHKALLENQHGVIHRVLEQDKAFDAVKEFSVRALGRLPEWRLQRDGWTAVETGLRHVYRTGRRAFALASEDASVENLHELRKQAKYLWHQLQLLEAVLPDKEKPLIDQTHTLSTLLGEDHDLAVFRETLAADPLSYGGHRVLKGVFDAVDRRRHELEREAFALAGDVYKDAPKSFIARMEPSMVREAVT